MPFDEPFQDNYEPGDLFYGFSAPRAALMAQLGVPTRDRGLGGLYVINNYMITGEEKDSVEHKLSLDLAAFREKLEDDLLSDFKKTLQGLSWREKEPLVTEQKRKLESEIGARVESRRNELMDPHQRFENTLKIYKSGKYDNALNFRIDSAADKENENAKQNSAWRRKCKGGLYYCIFELQKTVHFCLGASEKVENKFVELDHSQVVTKKDPFDRDANTDTKAAKLRVITPAELRWIYRNRMSDEVRNHVQFWRPTDSGNWEPCGAPWKTGSEQVRNTWESYKPKSNLVHSKID